MKGKWKNLFCHVICACLFVDGIFMSIDKLTIENSKPNFDHKNISNDKRIVCYFGKWSVDKLGFDIENDIDPNICTHIIYAFVDFDEHGTLVDGDTGNIVVKFSGLDH